MLRASQNGAQQVMLARQISLQGAAT